MKAYALAQIAERIRPPELVATIHESLDGFDWHVVDRRSGAVLQSGSADSRGFAHVAADAAGAEQRATRAYRASRAGVRVGG